MYGGHCTSEKWNNTNKELNKSLVPSFIELISLGKELKGLLGKALFGPCLHNHGYAGTTSWHVFLQQLKPMVQEETHCWTSGPGSKGIQSLRRVWKIRMQLVRIRQSYKQIKQQADSLPEKQQPKRARDMKDKRFIFSWERQRCVERSDICWYG